MKKPIVRIRMPGVTGDGILITHLGKTFVISQINVKESGWHRAARCAITCYAIQGVESPDTMSAMESFAALLSRN